MRITIVSEYYVSRTNEGVLSTGGAEVTAYRIARELATRHEVSVICSRQPGALAEEFLDGHRVWRAGPVIPYTQFGQRLRRAHFQLAVRRAVVRSRPEVVFNFALTTSWAAAMGAKSARIPAIAFVMDVWRGRWASLVGPLAGPIAERVEAYLLGLRWAKYVAISGATADRLVDAGIDRARVAVVPPVVEVESASQARPIEIRGGPVLCHVGRLVRYKGVDTLVRATALLAKGKPDTHLLVVGEGPERQSLESLAGELGIAKNVTFLGTGSDLSYAWSVMAASDVFVLASTVEGFGIVVPEAMAAGTAVVCSDIPALRWVTDDGMHARLVPPGDEEAFAAAIEEQLAKPLEATRASAAAARAWAEQFSAARVCEKVERVVEEVGALRSSHP